MKKIITLVIIIIIILGGKWFIDNKTIQYEELVNESLSSYYISGNTKELQPIIDLLEKVKKDDKLKKEIQDYSLSIVNSWYTYLESKYNCSKSDLNSCLTQVDEYTLLDSKLKNLYSLKCSDGFTIILPSAYTNLVNVGEEKIASLNKMIKSPSAKEQKNSEEIRIEKCNKATTCESCRDGLCTCTYINDNKSSETISCADPNYTPTT